VSKPEQAASSVADALKRVLSRDLVAVYLHGSAVLDGFRWDRSDLDVLGLSRETLSDEQIRGIIDALVRLPYPANGLELILMTADEAAAPDLPAPRFQIQLATGGRSAVVRVVDGRAGGGDTKVVLHLAVCRARGLALAGPPPHMSLGAVPDQTLLSVMRSQIGWARTNGALEYLVLTCARFWLFAETRRLSSKVDAGRWALERYSQPRIIAAALARYDGANLDIDKVEADRLATYVEGIAT
jgi:hypothetical protein